MVFLVRRALQGRQEVCTFIWKGNLVKEGTHGNLFPLINVKSTRIVGGFNFYWDPAKEAAIREAYNQKMATRCHDFTNRLCKRKFCPGYTTQEIFDSFKKMCSTPKFKAKFKQCGSQLILICSLYL
ncbi:hypothetical protein Scep_023776 [Stephania cephalantha]|uniref:Uncharacterized protein n=1 Tax=Stephania cephalantha TaxID=152367 RepID=A0AAP0EWC2_9MAGN